MFTTRIDLSLDTRKNVVVLLNKNLASLIDLQLQCKQAHWNVKGPHFIGLHGLFDSAYEEVEGFVDTIAERVMALGGAAEGTIQVVVENTRLLSYPLNISSGVDHINNLSTAIALVGKSIRSAITESEKYGDIDTSNIFTDISIKLDKLLWFIEAHVQE